MALVKKPPESVNRSLSLEKPVSELLDDYCRFVDCTPDYVSNFTLRKTLARDPDFKKWKASQRTLGAAAPGVQTRGLHDPAVSPIEKPHRLPARGGNGNLPL